MLKPSRQSFLRWGLTLLDVSFLLFALFYNPATDYYFERIFMILGLGLYKEGIVIMLWVWGISFSGLLMGLFLLIASLFIRSEKPGVLSRVKGQLLFTGILLVIAVFLWFQVFIFG